MLRDELRKRAPDVGLGSISVADLGPSPSRIAAERDEQRLLLAGLRAIPFEYQIALELHFFEELSRAEGAALLGIPPGTLASRIRRGRELLAAAIEQLAGSIALANATVTALDAWARELRARIDER